MTVTYWPWLSTSKHRNSTAYVDNQINTNILYTIKYKRAKKYNMNQNLAYEKAEMQINHSRATK